MQKNTIVKNLSRDFHLHLGEMRVPEETEIISTLFNEDLDFFQIIAKCEPTNTYYIGCVVDASEEMSPLIISIHHINDKKQKAS